MCACLCFLDLFLHWALFPHHKFCKKHLNGMTCVWDTFTTGTSCPMTYSNHSAEQEDKCVLQITAVVSECLEQVPDPLKLAAEDLDISF